MPGGGGAADLHVTLRREPSGRWSARAETDPPLVVRASSREACLREVRRRAAAAGGSDDGPILVTVEELPSLVGVAEAAAILGWDKRRVITYVDRGRFPPPIERLAGGRIWRRGDVEAYAAEWRARRRKGTGAPRKRGTPRGRRRAGPSS